MKRIAIIISLAILVAAFAGCSASNSYYEPTTSAAERSPQGMDEVMDEAWDWEDDWIEGEENTVALPLETPSNSGNKLVYTVKMALQTTGFEEGTRTLLGVVSEMGGYVRSSYVEGRSLYDQNVERYAAYTLQIPSDNLAEFLVVMEDRYNLLYLEQESRNITTKHTGTNVQLENLKDQELRLLAELESAKYESEEKLALERELAGVQAQIARMTASVQGMDSAVLYSTVTIQLYEVLWLEEPGQGGIPFAERLGETAGNAWSGFVAFCQGVVLFLVAALPVLVILAVLAAIALLVRRAVKAAGGLPLRMRPAPRVPAETDDASTDGEEE